MKLSFVLLLVVSFSTHNFALKECIQPPRLKQNSEDLPCETPKIYSDFCVGPSCFGQRFKTDVCQLLVHSLQVDFDVVDVILLPSNVCKQELSAGDLVTTELAMQTFENEELVILHLNGSSLQAAIEYGLDEFHGYNNYAAYPRVGGMRFMVTPKNPFGARMKRPQVMTPKCGWKNLENEAIYSVLTTQGLAEGGLGYEPFVSQRATKTLSTNIHLPEAFLFYAQSVCKVLDPFRPNKQTASRITRKIPSLVPGVNRTKPLLRWK